MPIVPKVGVGGLLAAVTLALLILPARTALSQGITTGTIAGTVEDASGAMVANATVSAANAARSSQFSATSSASGNFAFHSLPIGVYSVQISAPGFSATTIQNVQVNSGITTNLNAIKLKVGQSSTQVEVNGSSAELLQTTASQVTTIFSTRMAVNLPLNGGPDTIAEVIPGVVSVHGDAFSNQSGDGYSVNGQSGRYNNSEIDGQSNNDNSIGGPQYLLANQDAIQQIQVVTNSFGAQYGRNAGGIINYITKSGSNALHGSAFEYYQGQFLSSFANQQKSSVFGYCTPGESSSDGCAKPVLPRFVENRWGGSLGGPAWKNKVFFFGSTYFDHIRVGGAPASSLPYVTPTPAGLKQLAAAFPGNNAVAALTNYGPFSVAAGNPTPVGITQESIPLPGGGSTSVEFAGVQRNVPELFNDQEDLGRLDFQPTSRDHFFVRYMYQKQLVTPEGGGEPGQIANGDWIDIPSGTHSVGGDWTHTFTEHLVDQLRYSFQENRVFFQGGSYPSCTSVQIDQCPSQVSFGGGAHDLGFGVNGAFPQGRNVKVTQIQNNAIWTKGNNTILLGGELDYQNAPNFGLFFYSGALNYQTMSDFIGDGNNPNDYMQLNNGPAVTPFTEIDASGYLQDDWKVTPEFTAHLGLRWEFFSQAANLLHRQTVANQSNPATAFWDTSLPLSATTDPSVANNYKGFQPRIGFAYNPSFDKKLVVKGGYSINQNPVYYNLILLASSAAPVVNFGYIGCMPGISCLPSNGSLLGGDVRAANLQYLPTGGDPRSGFEQFFPTHLRTPYVQTYTLAIEHQLASGAVGSMRYVGSKTTDDFQSVNYNPFLQKVAQAFPSFVSPSSLCQDPNANGYGRPNCDYNMQSFVTNGGWANYNALELNLTTRNYRGLTMVVSYTWSKSMNNVTDGFRSTGSAGSTIAYAQNPLDPSAGERGLSGNDFPNVVGIAFNYQLPKLAGSGWLSHLTNGFDLYGIYRFNSGQVYTPFQLLTLDSYTNDRSFCDYLFNANTVGGDTCRLVLSNKKAPINTVAYLNPDVSVNGVATPGTPHYIAYDSDGMDANGNYQAGTPTDPASAHWIINNMAYAESVGNPYPGSSRSTLRGQSFSELDASIMKTTQINERFALQLSVSAYNALNQMYLGTGIANVATGPAIFTHSEYNDSGTVPSGSGFVSGNRFILLMAKVVF